MNRPIPRTGCARSTSQLTGNEKTTQSDHSPTRSFPFCPEISHASSVSEIERRSGRSKRRGAPRSSSLRSSSRSFSAHSAAERPAFFHRSCARSITYWWKT